MDEEFTYDIGASCDSRINSTEPIQIAARVFAALDYGINPATGEIDCKFNYVDDYRLAFWVFKTLTTPHLVVVLV